MTIDRQWVGDRRAAGLTIGERMKSNLVQPWNEYSWLHLSAFQDGGGQGIVSHEIGDDARP